MNSIKRIILNHRIGHSLKTDIHYRYKSSMSELSSPDITPITSSSSSPSPPQSLPLITHRQLTHLDKVNVKVTPPKDVWVENMNTPKSVKLGIVQLHPLVFGVFPRSDIIQKNIVWQTNYRKVDYLCLKTRAEMPGGGKKPWPQKGTGRARQGSVRAPQWVNGGWSHGPRGPKTHFSMLPFFTRVSGLTSTLSAKLAQNDLKVIDTLESFPSEDPQFMEDFCNERGWGPSVLFVDKHDIMPKNISLATDSINHINLMPVYGLNVYSMLKHETLVLTLEAVEEIEEKILFQLSRTDLKNVIYKYKPNSAFKM